MRSSRRRRRAVLHVSIPLFAVLALGGPAPAADRVRQASPRADGASPAVRSRFDLALVHEDFVDAFQLAVQALVEKAHDAGGLDPETLAALRQVGSIAYASGDLDIAADVLDLALEWRDRAVPQGDSETAAALFDMGSTARLILPRATAAAEASRYFERAMDLVRTSPEQNAALIGRILQAQANVTRARSMEAAIPLYQQALALRRRWLPSPSYDIADNLTWLGWVQYQSGRHAEALRTLGEAERELSRLQADDVSILGTVLERCTDALLLAGRWSAAESLAQRTATAFEKARQEYLTGFARAAVPLNGYDLLALAQIEQGKYDAAWESTERFRGNVALDYTALARARWQDAAADSLQREQREWTEAHDGLDLARLRREGPSDRDDWSRFLRTLQAQARLFTLERDRLRVARPAPVTLRQFQQALPPRTAFLSFLRASLGGSRRQTRGPMRDVLYLCVLRPDRPVEWVRVWDIASPAALDRVSSSWRAMESARTRASQWRYRIEPDPGYADTLRALGRTIFDPLEHALDGIDAIVAEYPLSGFPLEHLRDAQGRYLIDRFVFSYVPSATVAQLLGQRSTSAPHVAHDRALVVGDPDLSPGSDRTWRRFFAGASASPGHRTATRESLAILPRLVHAGDEVRGVAATFAHATTLVHERASEGALQRMAARGELLRFRSLHFATHFLTDARPQHVAIALAPDGPGAGHDGILTAREIECGWQVDADLVTLGGCLAARGARLTDGSEFVGLTQVLYGAGARSVIASLWEVDDEATALLMRRFYEDWTGSYRDVRAGSQHKALPAAVALTEARRWLRDLERDGTRPFAHPVYWAGFVLTGVCD